MSLARGTPPDLQAVRSAVADGHTCAFDEFERCRQAANAAQAASVFVRRFDESARATARAVDALRAAGAPLPPLAGLAVSIKDLFDVAGAPTTAGSRVLAEAPSATADCPAVQRLRQAGAALIGHTNLSEFAFSGVGINPHHGTPANGGTLGLDATPRVPGGSTSGGATSVALGAAWAALGSDTGGSIRIPAALQGLVGFKGTQRLVPLQGCIPLSTTLDTACAITRSVRDAALLHGILSGCDPAPRTRPPSTLRLAVPRTVMLDGCDDDVARAFDAALARLRAAGATVDEITLAPLARLGALTAAGGFAAAESWAWHRGHLDRAAGAYDPRVAMRIRRGAAMTAADYIDLLNARREWIGEMQGAIETYDALLSPTVPIVAPPLAPLLEDDELFFRVNGLLLRNPSAVNFLDGCALSLPCHAPGSLPVGLMVWSHALADRRVLEVSLAVDTVLSGH